ncbi:CcdB family protein [Marinoscillum sp.]|uniref:CcdB family protein n=1 Tax=Marinoscillum sp. TaxID=2024838 RepID=UPI003BAA135F
MARFDVFKVSDTLPLLLDVQSGVLSDLSTRVVIPLLPVKEEGAELTRLHPIIKLECGDYVLRTAELSYVPEKILNEPIYNIEADYRDEIINALDFLFLGF